MNFNKKGAVIGFVAGVAGGGIVGILELSLIQEIAIAISTVILVAMFVNLVWG